MRFLKIGVILLVTGMLSLAGCETPTDSESIKTTYTVNIAHLSGGSLAVSKAGIDEVIAMAGVPAGETITVKIIANPGQHYVADSLKYTVASVETPIPDDTKSFKMPAGNVVISAVFAETIIEENTIIQIATSADLAKIGTDAAFPRNGNYRLSANMTLENWVPIGNDASPFTGSFDGDNKTITVKSFNISNTRSSYGIFGVTEGALIKNLNIAVTENITVNFGTTDTTRPNAGLLVGRATNTAIQKIKVSGTGSLDIQVTLNVVNSRFRIGGIVGFLYGIPDGFSAITDSDVTLNITASAIGTDSRTFVGGITGVVDQGWNIRRSEAASINNCRYKGNITSTNNGNRAVAGGIVGDNGQYSLVINSSAEGNITAIGNNRAFAGGIAGNQAGGSRIYRCYYNSGKVFAKGDGNANSAAGGILACSWGEEPMVNGVVVIDMIEECYSVAEVEANSLLNTANAGGISGSYSGLIKNSFSVAKVLAKGRSANAGGITGSIGGAGAFPNGFGRVYNSYSLGEVEAERSAGNAFAGGIAGGNNGVIAFCVALNTKITSNDTAARIADRWGLSYIFSQNLAINDMDVFAVSVADGGSENGNGPNGAWRAESAFVKTSTTLTVFETNEGLNFWDFNNFWKYLTDYSKYPFPVLRWMDAAPIEDK